MANKINSGALASNASYNTSTFVAFTVYAASGSTVTATAANKTATYTLPASNVLTITDHADSISVNAAFVVVGMVSTGMA